MVRDPTDPIPPGATIGILGGGQLGRMIALAAAELGYRCHVYCPEPESPAADVAAVATVAAYDDRAALDAFARAVDVVTLEFENIPVATVEHLAKQVAVRPGADALRITQDRLLEKDFVRASGGGTADYRAVGSRSELAAALAALGTPAILKTRRFGYDGKGQTRIASLTDADAAWNAIGSAPCILEAFVPFALEVSVIVARAPDGTVAAFVPVENRHKAGILDVTIAPAPIAPATMLAAEALARRLAERLGIVGMLAVEMFVTRDGAVLVNELAPRVHNSGHWTIEACVTSQFEQNVRAVCGLPLGSPARHSNAVMRNLIGADVERWADFVRQPDTKLHLYGKRETRAGRTMGHVTRLYPLDVTPAV